MLAPALAVDGAGRRLGQGGGSYDRALERAGAPVVAVVFDDEVLDGQIPVEAHDRPGRRRAHARRRAALAVGRALRAWRS